MTGGGAEIDIRSMEVLKDDGSFHCSLTDLPGNHFGHTQTVLDVCGSDSYRISCLSFTSAGFISKVTRRVSFHLLLLYLYQ